MVAGTRWVLPVGQVTGRVFTDVKFAGPAVDVRAHGRQNNDPAKDTHIHHGACECGLIWKKGLCRCD